MYGFCFDIQVLLSMGVYTLILLKNAHISWGMINCDLNCYFAQKHEKDIAKQEDPFDPLTDQIPEQPVTFAEGASYSLVIFAGLAVAAGAAYAVFKELIFEPKE